MSGLLRSSRRLLLADLSATVTPMTTTAIPGKHNLGERCRTLYNNLPRQVTVITRNTTSSASLASTSKNGLQQEESIKITDKCIQRLRDILDENGSFLRISVEGGGCSGFQYKFDVDNQLSSDDIVISKDSTAGENNKNGSALVVVDEISVDLIRGSTLDYETELIRSSFRIISNPRAEQGCSCGASFNMKL